MIFIPLVLVAGALGAIIASNKGRSGVGWFFLCVLFPPLVLILLALKSLEKETPAPTQVIVNAPTATPAPTTASNNPAPNNPGNPPPDDLEIKDSRITFPGEIQCPMCAETIKGEARMCRFCKSSLAEWRAEYIEKANAMFAHIEPGHENLPAGQMLATGNYYQQEGNEDKARAYFQLLVWKFPGTEEASIANTRIG